jgi:co-chaperonin GroES (HSP10)
MKFTPIRDHVLVELDPFDPTFDGGPILRPDIAAEKPIWGTVAAVGPGLRHPIGLRPGARVIVPWATGHDLSIAGRLHVLLRESQILAVEVAA